MPTMAAAVQELLKVRTARMVWGMAGLLASGTSRTTPDRFRVLSGPIFGACITIPHRERLSMALGTYEGHVVSAMRAHVRPGMAVYDIGAHIGYLTLVLSRLVSATGTVIAVEPDPNNRLLLSANLKNSGASNVEVLPSILSDNVGEAKFATFETYSSVSHIVTEDEDVPADARLTDLPTTSLDHLVFDEHYPAPQFIKIDVEGAEDRVFLGMLRTLKGHRPVVLAEARVDSTMVTLTTLTRALGYSAHILNPDSRLAKLGVIDVLFQPGAIDR